MWLACFLNCKGQTSGRACGPASFLCFLGKLSHLGNLSISGLKCASALNDKKGIIEKFDEASESYDVGIDGEAAAEMMKNTIIKLPMAKAL